MRLLLIANDFPNLYWPSKGVFNLYLARALAAEHDVQVVSPIPWVDEWKAIRGGAKPLGPERHLILDGIKVYYPQYYYPPKIFRQHYGQFYWYSVRNAIWQSVESEIPDAVIAYWAHPDGEAAVHIGRLLGIPSMVMVGGSDVLLLSREPGRRRCVQSVLEGANSVVTVSQDLKAKVEELGVRPDKVHVWSQGVDERSFHPGDRAESRRRLGIPVEGKHLLWVGRMVPIKALDVLLRSCGLLRDRGVAHHLYLVGDGPLRGALEKQTAYLGLSRSVTFVGSRSHEELPDWYRAADLTLLPSWSEGLPNVLRESLACGTSFVASRVGGIPELADDPSRQLVPPGDPAALAEVIAGSLQHADGGPRPASRSTSWRESARSLVELLAPLVSTSQNPDCPWWATSPRPAKDPTPRRPSRWRQMIRRAMAVLSPKRLFLVRGPQASASICLTFDDGPHPVHTPRLLDALKAHGITANFFVVGRMARQYPDLVRRMAAEGHLIGNHSYYHADLRKMSGAEMARGVRRTRALLEKILGEAPDLFRPPNGKLRLGKLFRLWGMGQTVVLWNADPKDYNCRSAAEVFGWFEKHPPRAGDVVLMHDRLPFVADVVPLLAECARRHGLEFSKLSDWVA